jgi:branched-chain amino acid transport system substrate-binding protein
MKAHTVFQLTLSFIFFLCIMGVISGCGQKGPRVVKVALVAPLTGDIAAHGQGMKRASQLAIEEAIQSNRFKDFKLELAAFDDRGDPKEAVTIANQIISDPSILGIVGHLNSGCSIPASQVYAKRNVLMITPASTNPKLTQQGLRNVFRLCTTDDVQGKFAADYAVDKLKIERAALVHDKTAYGQGLVEEFKKQFEARKGQVLSYDGIDVGEKDFKALLTRIKGENPQLIYFGGMHPECGLLSKQAKELGLSVPVFAGDGVLTPEYAKIGGPATEGDYASMTGLPPEKLPASGKFIADYHRRFPKDDMQPYDPYTYEAINIILDAIEKTGGDRNKMIDYIAKVTYSGILGESSFDERGDTRNKTITIYTVKNGLFNYVD